MTAATLAVWLLPYTPPTKRSWSTARLADVLLRRYGGDRPEPRATIAAAYGVTPERVRQAELKALRILGHPARRAFLQARRTTCPPRLWQAIVGTEEAPW